MPIKYADIVIVRNLEEEGWFNYCKRMIGNENIVYDNDTIIIIFEDETITDTKREYVDKQFVMGPKVFNRVYPTYFNKKTRLHCFIRNQVMKMEYQPSILSQYLKTVLNILH